MKIKSKTGKEYLYSYKTILLKPEVAYELQELRKMHKVSYSDLLMGLIQMSKTK